jgi:DNA repair protein RecN (Recombination protein N)
MISNYILIDNLQIDFSQGFTTMTGETGAGKSIILGALALATGERADNSQILNRNKKCVVEVVFEKPGLPPPSFFEKNQIDCLPELILRREILPAGTSRAFINDCPVTLALLKETGRSVIDVHSQHQNLLLNSNAFQLNVIDSLAGNHKMTEQYSGCYKMYLQLRKKLEELKSLQEQSLKDKDFIHFQYRQLEDASLKEGEKEELEAEQKILENAGDIIDNLRQCSGILSQQPGSVISALKEIRTSLSRTAGHVLQASQWQERIESVLIELRDISAEIEVIAGKTEVNPVRLEQVNERLNTLYSLLLKHKEKEVCNLIGIRDDLARQLNEIESFSDEIEKTARQLDAETLKLNDLAVRLSKKRHHTIPVFTSKMTAMATELGMPHARIDCSIKSLCEPGPMGTDDLRFLFSSNPQTAPEEISKAASGGELSRIMLCLKSLLAGASRIPTLIFDEIDTGLSGEIAHKMSMMMKNMAAGIQVIAITHLPQIAAAGSEHILVYKETRNNESHTCLQKLEKSDRLNELARMLSGKKVTPAALKNAEDLLKQIT